MRHLTLTIELFPADARNTLWLAHFAGIFATTLTGGSVVPWIWAVVRCVSSYLSSNGKLPLSFPNPLDFLLSPNWLTSGVWLLYYFVTVISSSSSALASVLHLLSGAGIQLSFAPSDHLGISVYHALQREASKRDNDYSFSFPPEEPQTLLLSQAWKGEKKYHLVERCYETYRQALTRYHPLPFTLQTPETFYYHESASFSYEGTFPILPEALLTEERYEELLPSLAQHLYWYYLKASGKVHLQIWTLDSDPVRWFLLLTGNFLWLPADYCRRITEACMWKLALQQSTGVLEADAFAALLGQGPALERQLRLFQKEMKERRLKDTNTPTIAERIGHLETLNEHERQEVRFLIRKALHDKSLNPNL
jgi:hypothetical protein